MRRGVIFCSGKFRSRAAKRRTRRNGTAARLKRTDPRTLFGRGPRLESSAAMIQRSGVKGSMPPCPRRNPIWVPGAHQVGCFIPREFCRWHSGTPRRARFCSKKHCLHQRPECLFTSAVWLSREQRPKLNLNDFNAPIAKPVRKFLGGAVVGDETPDSIEGAYLRNAAATQFAEVRNHVHFSRGADHHTIQLGFEHIRCRWAVCEIETVDRQKETVGVKLIHHGFCLWSYEGAGNRTQQSADHDQGDARRIRQLKSDVKRVSDDRERLNFHPFQMSRNLRGGCP